MVRLNNYAEGTDGTTVTTGNSNGGGGDAFSTISIGAGCTLTYSTTSAPAHGSSSLRFVNATGVSNYAQWTFSTTDTIYFRFYMRVPTIMAAATEIVRINNSGSSNAIQVNMGTSGKLALTVGGNSVFTATTAQAMVVDTWYMVEVGVDRAGGVASAATWAINCVNLDTDTVLFASSGTSTANNSFAQMRIGKASSSTVTTDLYIDTVTLDTGKTSLESLYAPTTSSPQVVGWGHGSTGGTTAANTIDLTVANTVTPIQDGDWMVATVMVNASAQNDPTPPTGWTHIAIPGAEANGGDPYPGTLEVFNYAKKWSTGDPATYTFTISGTARHLQGTVFWVRSAADVSSWVIGSDKLRVNAPLESLTSTAPSVTTTAANSVALSFFYDRTTAAENSSAITVAGTSKLFTNAQVGSNLISTFTLGSKDVPSSGTATGDAVATYPNSQTANGVGWQIAVPAVVANVSYSGTANFSATGTISQAGSAALSSAQNLAGAGTLSQTGSAKAISSAALSATGTLGQSGAPGPIQTQALSGSGTLTQAATPGGKGSPNLTGSGTLAPLRVRTNLYPNPEWVATSGTALAPMITDGASYTVSAGVLSLTAASGNMRVVTEFGSYLPVVPGKTYTVSARRKLLGATNPAAARINVYPFNPTTTSWYGYPDSSNQSNVGGLPDERVSTTFTVPAGYTLLEVGLTTGNTAGDQTSWSELLIEEGSTVLPFFDGSIADTATLDRAWTGTANNSPSTETNTMAGGPALPGSAGLSGTGTLAQTAASGQKGSGALSGTGALASGTQVPKPIVVITPSASGTLTATGGVVFVTSGSITLNLAPSATSFSGYRAELTATVTVSASAYTIASTTGTISLNQAVSAAVTTIAYADGTATLNLTPSATSIVRLSTAGTLGTSIDVSATHYAKLFIAADVYLQPEISATALQRGTTTGTLTLNTAVSGKIGLTLETAGEIDIDTQISAAAGKVLVTQGYLSMDMSPSATANLRATVYRGSVQIIRIMKGDQIVEAIYEGNTRVY